MRWGLAAWPKHKKSTMHSEKFLEITFIIIVLLKPMGGNSGFSLREESTMNKFKMLTH